MSWPNVHNVLVAAYCRIVARNGDGDDIGWMQQVPLGHTIVDGRIIPADCGAVKHVGAAAQFIVRWVVR
jgi:hypothetical protein